MRQRSIGWVLLVALLVLPVWGAVTLFRLRFQVGDVYPPYSSFRADPMGARALFEAVDRLAGVESRRHLKAWSRLGPGENTALLVLGMPVEELATADLKEMESLERFAREGGAVVLGLVMSDRPASWLSGTNITGTTNTPAKGPTPRRAVAAPVPPGAKPSMLQRWGLEMGGASGADGGGEARVRRSGDAEAGLPEVLPWVGRWWLQAGAAPQDGAGEWRTVYGVGEEGGALVLERTMGRGRMVVCAESFLFSNEALRHRRESGFLLWTLRGAEQALFAEEHLGVSEEPGVGTLLRRYRLQGWLLGLALVAGVWVWHRVPSLVPAGSGLPGDQEGEVVEGRGSMAGLVSLLRKHVPAAEILPACFREWRRGGGLGTRLEAGALARKAERMEVVMVQELNAPARERNPAAAYGEMRKILEETTWKRSN